LADESLAVRTWGAGSGVGAPIAAVNAESWNARYAGADFVYGTAPNDFVAAVAAAIPPGPVLCLAEGEGRNAVWLAARGHAVTAVDHAEIALAKAEGLAAARGVKLTTVATDLGAYCIELGAWAGIVSVWAHLPSVLRRTVHGQVVRGLQPGGVYILEAYTPTQLTRFTGGPRDEDSLMTAELLRAELAGLEFEILREVDRMVHEGNAHNGPSFTVQVLARKP